MAEKKETKSKEPAKKEESKETKKSKKAEKDKTAEKEKKSKITEATKTTKKTEKPKESEKVEVAKKVEEPKTAEKAEAAAPNATLQKKRERREAKAARKAANQAEEKKTRPNNIILAVMIFGVLVVMFAVVAGYNYFSKPASIEKYIEDNGGEEVYGSMMIDAYTTAAITAEGNNMYIVMNAETEDEDAIEEIKEYYGGDDGEDQLESIGAYFLTSMKPEVRGFGGSVDVKMSLNGEEIESVDMTYNEAKKAMKEAQEEAEEDAVDAEDNELDIDEDTEAVEVGDESAKDSADASEE